MLMQIFAAIGFATVLGSAVWALVYIAVYVRAIRIIRLTDRAERQEQAWRH